MAHSAPCPLQGTSLHLEQTLDAPPASGSLSSSSLQSTGRGSDGFSKSHSRSRVPSLADLPFDVLHLIGEFIQPATISIPSLLSSTSATPWIEWGRDLYSFSSTCRVIWSATRGLTGRKYGFHGRTVSREEEERDALRRLETLKGAGSGQKVGPFETCATKLRHFYFRTCLPSFFLDHSALFVDKVSLMSNLASIAIVYKTEDAVVATSPYSTTPLPADVVRALAQLANLRSLYLGGIKLTGLRDSFEASRCRFGSHVKTLVLRAVHDTALLLLPLVPSATRISLWRDFAHHPRIDPSSWWQEHSWDCVEDLELYGFSGIQGRALMCTLVDSLLSRTVPALQLRSLSLPEPFLLAFFNEEIVQALTQLPNLRSFAVFIWNDSAFGPTIVEKIHAAAPGLEELSLGVDGEQPHWWKGNLHAWGEMLARFDHLREFTWNYSPYSRLSWTELRGYVADPLRRGICAIHPSLQSVKWFGVDLEWKKSEESGLWGWKDDDTNGERFDFSRSGNSKSRAEKEDIENDQGANSDHIDFDDQDAQDRDNRWPRSQYATMLQVEDLTHEDEEGDDNKENEAFAGADDSDDSQDAVPDCRKFLFDDLTGPQEALDETTHAEEQFDDSGFVG